MPATASCSSTAAARTPTRPLLAAANAELNRDLYTVLYEDDRPELEPATYLVAVDRRTGHYVGLLHLWMDRAGPRLGCLAVLPPTGAPVSPPRSSPP